MKRFPLLLIAALVPCQGLAYTRATYKAIAVESLRLAPPALARMGKRYRKQLQAGALVPLSTEGGAGHLAAPRGFAERKLADQADRVIDLINHRTPFSKIVFELGILCHYAADLNNPLNTSRHDPRYERIRKDFEAYVARKRPRFLLTFLGHTSPSLRRGDVKEFGREVSARSAKLGPYLIRSYFPSGRMVSSRSFDDRHTAFGIASLSFQNAVGDCASLFVYIWRKVNGDLRGTPFLASKRVAPHPVVVGTFH